MPELSIFTSCGMLELSGRPARPQVFYQALIDAYGPGYDFTPENAESGSAPNHMEASVYARAMALARASNALDRAGNQYIGATAWDLLLLLAQDCSVIPAANDTIPSLAAKISAAQILLRGARFEAVVAGLSAILGANFLSYRPLATSEAQAFPQWPSAVASVKSNPTLPVVATKWCTLVNPVGVLGSPVSVTYTNLDVSAGEVDLAVGDVVMVEPENTAVSEKVTVTAISGSGAARNVPVLSFWAGASTYSVGALVEPVPANGYAYACTTAGTSAAGQPAWPTMPGLSVTDGSATWTCTGTRTTVATGLETTEDVALPMAWSPATLFPVGLVVQPRAPSALYYSCTTAGISATGEPEWPTTPGLSIQDGIEAVWTCEGFIGATRQFTGTFQYPHGPGANVTTMSWPYQWSTQRFALIVVSSAAAVAPELRRQVNVFMSKAARAVSQWAIVQPSSTNANGGVVGPFAAGASPIGAVPIGSLAYDNVP